MIDQQEKVKKVEVKKKETITPVTEDIKVEHTPRRDRRNWGGNIVPAFFFIFLGLLFLANNLGIVPWFVWAEIWKFWPVFLILLGFQFLLGKSFIARILMTVLTLLALLAIFIYILSLGNVFKGTQFENNPLLQRLKQSNQVELIEKTTTIAESNFSGINKREISVESGIGELVVNDNTSTDFLVLKSIYPNTFKEPELETEAENGLLKVEMDLPGKGMNPGFMGMNSKIAYELNVGKPELKTNLDIEVGTGKAIVNLTQLNLDNVALKVGVGSAEAVFVDQSLPFESLRLDVGVGSIQVFMPENVGLDIDYNVGIGNLNIDGQDIRGDGSFKTQDFDNALRKLKVSVDVGTGSINIKRQ